MKKYNFYFLLFFLYYEYNSRVGDLNLVCPQGRILMHTCMEWVVDNVYTIIAWYDKNYKSTHIWVSKEEKI